MRKIVFDFSRVILFPKDAVYQGSLNKLYKEISIQTGFSFSDNYYLNQELLDYLETLKEKVEMIVFTSGVLHEHPEVSPKISMFNLFIKSGDYNLDKANPESFYQLAKILGTPEKELVFIDDSEKNIVAAKKAGLQTHHYVNNPDLFVFLKNSNLD